MLPANYSSPKIAAANDDGDHLVDGLTTDADCTVYGSQGDVVAEFGSDENRLETAGARVHPAATNRLSYSKDFSMWSKVRMTVDSDAGPSPCVGRLCDKLVLDSSLATTHYVLSTFTAAASTAYRCSFYVARTDPVGIPNIAIQIAFATYPTVTFDLSNGVVYTTAGGATGRIEKVGSWYRCTLLVTSGAGDAGAKGMYILARSATFSSNLDGDGVSGIYVWGAQVETGNHSTPLILTNGAPASSIAPVIDAPGANDLGGLMTAQHLYNLSRDTIRPELRMVHALDAEDLPAGTYPLWTVANGAGEDLELQIVITQEPTAVSLRLQAGADVDTESTAWKFDAGVRYLVRLQYLGLSGAAYQYRCDVIDLDADALVDSVTFDLSTDLLPMTAEHWYLGCDDDLLLQWNFWVEEVSS